MYYQSLGYIELIINIQKTINWKPINGKNLLMQKSNRDIKRDNAGVGGWVYITINKILQNQLNK